MAEPMNVAVEVWPVAADTAGVWLLSGNDAWRPTLPVMADTEPHADAEFELANHGALENVTLMHSTSWRVDGPRVVLTYIAVVRVNQLVRDEWPNALPVSLPMAAGVGKPPTNAATEPPAPRYIDVLLHAIRHLRFLLDNDATARATFNETWRHHLMTLAPVLAGMYDVEHGRTSHLGV